MFYSTIHIFQRARIKGIFLLQTNCNSKYDVGGILLRVTFLYLNDADTLYLCCITY